MLAWFWLPGIIYGAIWVFARVLAFRIDPVLAAMVAVGVEAGVSGGLHWDGWADVFDGFGAGPERRRAARQDARLGAIGGLFLVLAVFLMIRLWADVLPHLSLWAAMVPPLLARAVLAAGVAWQPMDSSSRLGRWMQQETFSPGAGVSVVVALAVTGVLQRTAGLEELAGVLLAVGGFWVWSRGQYGGINGDVLGASAILTEIAALISLGIWGR